MTTFDDVIGYNKEKAALYQICDILKNPDKYRKLGAKCPKGMVLIGPPGVGKTLMANAMISDVGRPCFVCRRDASETDFIAKINKTFRDAEAAQPSVILLDDLDKFTEATYTYSDAEEHIAVQTCVDEMEGDVFVIATVNDSRKIPRALLRAGRLEEHVYVKYPSYADAREIIAHYLENKKIAADVDVEEITLLMRRNSCAGLEAALNEAALQSVYEGHDEISRDNLVKSLLRSCHGLSLDASEMSDGLRRKNSYYVAGQIVAFYSLYKNAVTFATVCQPARRTEGRGHVELAKAVSDDRSWEAVCKQSIGWLAGKAAYEHKFGFLDEEAGKDIMNAVDDISCCASSYGAYGFRFIDMNTRDEDDARTERYSEARLKKANEGAKEAFSEAKDIVAGNWDTVERLASALDEKLILTGAEIEAILND